jgi:hypothetical protein
LEVLEIEKDEETQFSNFKFREFGAKEASKRKDCTLELLYIFWEVIKFKIPFNKKTKARNI